MVRRTTFFLSHHLKACLPSGSWGVWADTNSVQLLPEMKSLYVSYAYINCQIAAILELTFAQVIFIISYTQCIMNALWVLWVITHSYLPTEGYQSVWAKPHACQCLAMIKELWLVKYHRAFPQQRRGVQGSHYLYLFNPQNDLYQCVYLDVNQNWTWLNFWKMIKICTCEKYSDPTLYACLSSTYLDSGTPLQLGYLWPQTSNIKLHIEN